MLGIRLVQLSEAAKHIRVVGVLGAAARNEAG